MRSRGIVVTLLVTGIAVLWLADPGTTQPLLASERDEDDKVVLLDDCDPRNVLLSPGQWLRALRHERGLKIKDVKELSTELAGSYNNDEFRVSPSRLSEIENLDLTPNIYKLYSLAAIYRVPYTELLKRYGVDQHRALEEPISAKIQGKGTALGSTGH